MLSSTNVKSPLLQQLTNVDDKIGSSLRQHKSIGRCVLQNIRLDDAGNSVPAVHFVCALVVFGALMLSTAAYAQVAVMPVETKPSGSWFAGGMLEQQPSGFGGVTLSLPGFTLGDGWAVRASGYASQYTYRSNLQSIDGSDKGGQLTALYQLSGEWGWVDLGAGVRYVDVTLSPVDPGNRRQGGMVDGSLVAGGGWLADPWRVDGYAEYGVEQRAYYTRAGITHKIGSGQFRLGAEAGLQGDMYYDRKSTGALAIFGFENGLEMRLSSGVTFQPGRSERGYVALSFSQGF